MLSLFHMDGYATLPIANASVVGYREGNPALQHPIREVVIMAATMPKHIAIARTQGEQAGMEAFLAAPSSRRWPSYEVITSKRKPETRLAAYCKLFKEQLEAPAVMRQVHAPKGNTEPTQGIDLMASIRERINPQGNTDNDNDDMDLSEMIAKAVQDAVASAIGGTEQTEAPVQVPAVVTAPVSKRQKVARPTVVKGSGIISSGIAWRILNTSGDFPAPSNLDTVATNGQLYSLNVRGLMGEAVMAALDA